MFTKRIFELQAKVLGSHVIPMCVSFDWNAGGARRWDLNKVNEYLLLGNFLVDMFQENPAFDLDKFNARVWDWFIDWVGPSGWDYLLGDRPGMILTGKEPRRDWAFAPRHTMSH
jgi:hypothetical protein